MKWNKRNSFKQVIEFCSVGNLAHSIPALPCSFYVYILQPGNIPVFLNEANFMRRYEKFPAVYQNNCRKVINN